MKPRLLNLIPLICFTALLGYACYAALVVGHWPYYSHPDPKDLPSGHLTPTFALFAIVGLGSVVLLPILYALYRSLAAWRRWPVPNQKKSYIFYGIGAVPWLIEITTAYVSRYSLLSWILD